MRRILYAAPISFDRKEYERDVLVDELLKRVQLMSGLYTADQQGYGIVSGHDPTLAPVELVVTASTSVTAAIDVSPGVAVFQTGEIIVFDVPVPNIRLSIPFDQVSVVYLQFEERETNAVATRAGALVPTMVEYLADPMDYVQVMDLSLWNALSSLELRTKIPLAVVNKTGSPTSVLLQIDMGRTNLASNRPWFSPVDIQHRRAVGSGTITAKNPHGLSIRDLSADGQTVYRLMVPHGMVVAKDVAFPKVPGKLCTQQITGASIQDDASGAITGVAGSVYFTASKFPTQILRVTDAATGLVDLAAFRVPGKPLIGLLRRDLEQEGLSSSDIKALYFSVDAASLPAVTAQDSSFTLSAAASGQEQVIAGGLDIGANTATVDLTDVGRIPQQYAIYMMGDGSVRKNPQVCLCYRSFLNIQKDVPVAASQPMAFVAPLTVGLLLGGSGPIPSELNVSVKLVGKDVAGQAQEATVTFTSSGYARPDTTTNITAVMVSIADAKYTKTTSVKFAQVTSVTVTSLTGISAAAVDSGLMVWANAPSMTQVLSDALPVGRMVWNGSKTLMLEDRRPINLTLALPRPSRYYEATRAYIESLHLVNQGVVKGAYIHQAWVEDFDRPTLVTDTVGTVGSGSQTFALNTTLDRFHHGLEASTVYVSRPLVVRQPVTTLQNLRVIPYNVGGDRATAPAHEIWVRWYVAGEPTGVWKLWVRAMKYDGYRVILDDLARPSYIPPEEASKLVKLQFAVKVTTGRIGGLAVLLETERPAVNEDDLGFIYDVDHYGDPDGWA